ncbi:hypothetical protein HORIV_31180 [Vreelandella olivaria]|uniref:Transposase n=1 Tax=Vreelandella olivaria TaxID=390919 RepID=A0ABM7GJ52_9GAMM|nr:hypothetical protein HORIV_31180 [Halomonas olivaria]
MPRFKLYNHDQNAMAVINYQDQFQPGTFDHAVHYLIEHNLNLSVFHLKYRNDGAGRLAYDPDILINILFACSPVRLFACSPVRLFACSPVRLFERHHLQP